MKIFVSNDISEKGVALLREHFDVDVMPNMKPEELIKVINNYDGLVTRSMTKVTKEVIEASTRLKVIGRAGVGVDNIDIPAATAKGIVVLNTPEGNTMAATEHTVAMMMAMTRHIPQAHQSGTGQNPWHHRRRPYRQPCRQTYAGYGNDHHWLRSLYYRRTCASGWR